MKEGVQGLIHDGPAFLAGMGRFVDAEEWIVGISLEIDQRHIISADQTLKFGVEGLAALFGNA